MKTIYQVYPVAIAGGVYCAPSTENGTYHAHLKKAPADFPENWIHHPNTANYPVPNIGHATAASDALWLAKDDADTGVPEGIWTKKKQA